MDECGEEVRKHVFDAARVDLVARDAAQNWGVVEFAPGGRGGGLGAVGVHGRARQLKAAGSVGQHREDGGVVGKKRVHEAVGGDEKAEAEQGNGCVLHGLHVTGRSAVAVPPTLQKKMNVISLQEMRCFIYKIVLISMKGKFNMYNNTPNNTYENKTVY